MVHVTTEAMDLQHEMEKDKLLKKIEKLEKQIRRYKTSNKIESTDEKKTKHDYNQVEGEDTETYTLH